MSFLNKVFGSRAEYPSLEADHPVAGQLHAVEEPLQSLMSQISDPLEIIPAENRTYVFIGKPPKRFGIAWIEDGQLINFQVMAKEMGLKPVEMQQLVEKLRVAYERNQSAQRYSATMSGRDIVVTTSNQLEQDVQTIIGNAIH
jgi:hypothetical protein